MRALIALIPVLVAVPAVAQPDGDLSDHISVRVDAQVLTDYDDASLFVNGFAGNVSGLWALSVSWFVCARFGISHWSFESESTVAGLVPPGAQLTFSQSSGQIDVISLMPTIRYARHDVFPLELGGFLEAGVGGAHVSTFAMAEIEYSGGGSGQGADGFKLDESETAVQWLATAGLTHAVSDSSWFEVLVSYTVIMASETIDIFGFGVGVQVWI